MKNLLKSWLPTRRSRSNGRRLSGAEQTVPAQLETLEDRALLSAVTARLTIFSDGSQVAIPADIGVSGGSNISQIHTVDADGNICIEPVGSEALEDQTLGDFFETWRTNAGDAGNNADAVFNGSQLFAEVADLDNTIQVFVNGVVNTDFESYVIQDQDQIVIAFGSDPIVSINTNLGPIVIELFETDAPLSVENFLNYVNDGDYIDSIIHRNASLTDGTPFVIQGGGFTTSSPTLTSLNQFTAVPTDDPVLNEPGISNLRGTVAMAKLGGDPSSATSQFFVNLGNNAANLDNQNGGFTVFGQVLDLTTSDAISDLSNTSLGATTAFTDLPITSNNEVVVVSSVEGLGSIEGVRFDDVNANAVFDTGDTPLANISVFIDANVNGILDTGEVSTTTDSNGRYRFDVTSGTYALATILTSGDVFTTSVTDRQALTVGTGRTVAADIGETTLQAVSGIDLPDAFDTGESNTDGLTNLNNSTAQSALQFTLSGVVPGATVEVFADGVIIGTATATADSVTVVTDGTTQLAEGAHTITATQRLQSVTSAVSSGLALEIDSIAPGDFTSLPPATVPVGTLFTFDVESPDEGSASYSVVNAPAGLTIDSLSGEISWTPTAAQAMPHDFQIVISDSAGNQTIADVEITVVTAVIAREDQYSVDEHAVLTVDAASGVLANDDPGQNATLTAQVVDQPTNGILTLNTDGSFEYTPTAGFFGTDEFTYRGIDGLDLTNIARVNITINAANAVPVAAADDYTVNEDTPLSVVAADGVLSNDTDADAEDTLTTVVVTDPANGTVSLLSDGSFSYTPDLNFNGTDTFTYAVTDGQDTVSPVTVTINVEAVNDTPNPTADEYTLDEDTVLTVSVADGILSNDSDVEGDTFTPTTTVFPNNGVVTVEDDGSFVYTPTANFSGTDQFAYILSDGISADSATVFVTLNVTAVPDDPTAEDDALTAIANGADQTLDVLANDSTLPDTGQTLTITNVSAGSAGGTLVISDAGDNIVYTPVADFVGTETFTYTVEDDDGLTATATGTIEVAVAAGTTSSSLSGVVFVDANGNGIRDVGEFTIPGVQMELRGTTDAGATTPVTVITDADGEWEFLALEAGTYQVTQTQPAGYTDGDIESAVGIVTANTVLDIPLNGLTSVVANFGESHMNSQHAWIGWRFASSFADGSSAFTGFIADVEGAEGNTDLETAIRASTDTVDNTNSVPVAAGDDFTVAQDNVLTVDAASGVLVNDTDADFDDVLTATIQTQPANGVVVLEDDGSFVYTPNAGFNGTDSFTYFISDQQSTATATVNITVTAATTTASGALPGAFDSVFSDADGLLGSV